MLLSLLVTFLPGAHPASRGPPLGMTQSILFSDRCSYWETLGRLNIQCLSINENTLPSSFHPLSWSALWGSAQSNISPKVTHKHPCLKDDGGVLSGGGEKPGTHSFSLLPWVALSGRANSVYCWGWKNRSQIAHPRLSKAMGRGGFLRRSGELSSSPNWGPS